MNGQRLLVAVDLGSNSFRLMIGRVAPDGPVDRIEPLDSLKRTVRLAAGLDADGSLDADAQARAVEALARFSERISSFAPQSVRAVGTNTFRVARNVRRFLGTAEAALGFPVEVISGREEARLIYLGAAHALSDDGRPRLVVDIGGGSTECVIGTDSNPELLESTPVGCVVLSQRWFPTGEVSRRNFDRAYAAACAAFDSMARAYRERGWDYAVGTSGTSKALIQIAQSEFGAEALDRNGLSRLLDALVEAGHPDHLQVEGLKPERRPVLAGGLAVMTAMFDSLGVKRLDYCSGALRHGVLHDLLGRGAASDPRNRFVGQMMERHGVDLQQARRVRDTALALFDQVARGAQEEITYRRQLLEWAAMLAECGMSISHVSFHKHTAYILTWTDMTGFSQTEQAEIALLTLAQTGGLRKLRDRIDDELSWLSVVSLRLSRLLHRARADAEPYQPVFTLRRRSLRLEMPADWAQRNPLAHASLVDEAAAWTEAPVFETFDYEAV